MKRISNIICQLPDVRFIGLISLSPSQLLYRGSYLLYKGGPSGKIHIDENIRVSRSEGNY